MIRGFTETGSIFVGLVPGSFLDRLAAGGTGTVPGYVDGNGREHKGFVLDFSKAPQKMALLRAGERVCVPPTRDASGAIEVPHLCIFVRSDNRALIAALDELFPGGPLPGALFEHVTTWEPD